MTGATGGGQPLAVSWRTAASATALMLVLHGLCYMAISVPAVIAPVAARDFGVDASRVGILVAFNYFLIMCSGLVCGLLVERYGIVRVCQMCAGLSALGLLSAAAIGGSVDTATQWWNAWNGWNTAAPLTQTANATPAAFALLLIASAALLGAGMGLVNPLGSQVLFTSTPAHYRTLVFSMKQIGSPIGTAFAGLVIPALLLFTSWPVALAAVSVPALLFVVAAPAMPAWMRQYEPREQAAAARLGWRTLVEPVRTLWGGDATRELGIVATLLAVNQLSVGAFLVTYLTLELGLSLVTAGTLFAVAQLAGLVARILWGVSADRWISARRQLGLMGVIGGASTILLTLATPDWSPAALGAVCALFGAAALSWNGILLAEVARLAGPGKIGAATGGVQSFMSFGAVIGPIAFSALVAASESYAVGFVVSAVPVLAMGVRMMATGRHA